MINLDDMTNDPQELMAWWDKYRWGSKANRLELFGRLGKGTVRAIKDCANYAANKAVAMQCRQRGDIRVAQQYESYCERIYNSLPSYAKW